MALISFFYALHSNEEQIISRLAQQTGYQVLRDADLVSRAAQQAAWPPEKICKAFASKTSLFNPFTREKEKALAYLRLAVAEQLVRDDLILAGLCSQLAPKSIAHVLRVCLVADMNHRLQRASEAGEKEAAKLLHASDEEGAAWVCALHGEKDPWNTAQYDMMLPTDKNSVEQLVALIMNAMQAPLVQPNVASRAAAADFLVQARVQLALALEGHEVTVAAKGGEVTLTIEKNVLMLSRLEHELQEIASKVEGVSTVRTTVGKDFHQADIYRKIDFQAPSKVLLVDDEREFVQTLSERLMLRDLGSAVVYDGESALQMVREDEPEVMILDLKMPGIDGMEVLRRVKETQPEIEVIILTGHGDESDREACMRLGAFAYLQKPVDIDILSETMKKANEKIMERRQRGEQ